jgi:Tfp pilus assembly protein PilE
MNRFHKIKAFTLVELIVVMLLTSLLVTALWGSFGLIQKFFTDGHGKNNRAERTLLLYNQLSEDFSNCKYVKKVSNDIVCVFGSWQVQYRISGAAIVRTQRQQRDTIKLDNLSCNFLELNDKHSSVLQGIDIQFQSNSRLLRYSIRKKYDAAFQLQPDTQ